nr:PHD finger protein ALFIN-LIKE 8-like [Parasteatoda tepidariorum]
MQLDAEPKNVTEKPKRKYTKKQGASTVQNKSGGKKVPKTVAVHKKNNGKQSEETVQEDEEEVFCTVCWDSYDNSRAGEEWVQCMKCSGWAHAKCSNGKKRYCCDNCE